MGVNLWTYTDHALGYLERADSIPHRVEGESTLLEFIPSTVKRILDLGTGDGRLLALVKSGHPDATAVAVDFSPAMLEAARKRFAGDPSVSVTATILKIHSRLSVASTPWFQASPFIISSTNASGNFTRRFTPG